MIISYLQLMRLYYVIPMAGGFIVIVLYRTGGRIQGIGRELVLSYSSLVLVIAAGYVLNDVCDVAADRINSPRRILPRGLADRGRAGILAGLLFAAGLVLGGMCNLNFLIAVGLIAAGLIFYDLYSKKIGFWKDILVAALMTSLYPLAFTLTAGRAGPRLDSLWISPFWLFFSTLGYEMLKDVRDWRGDRLGGPGSIAAISGRGWFLGLARSFAILGGIISLIPYFLGQCREVYLLSCLAAMILTAICVSSRSIRGLGFLYGAIFLVTAGALADLLIYGPLR